MLQAHLVQRFPEFRCVCEFGDMVLELGVNDLPRVMQSLRDDPIFKFSQLTDVTAIDYLCYQKGDWNHEQASRTGFSRARHTNTTSTAKEHRFSVIYQLLSHEHNMRLRVRVPLESGLETIPSMSGLWPSANWAEREVYDLFGLIFTDHPSLRRILTDYGFIGHPFRKDFPLSGTYELRYDAEAQAVVSEPTDHFARVEVNKVIRLGDHHE